MYHGNSVITYEILKLEPKRLVLPRKDLVFANEPIVQVEGPSAQCQIGRTAL